MLEQATFPKVLKQMQHAQPPMLKQSRSSADVEAEALEYRMRRMRRIP